MSKPLSPRIRSRERLCSLVKSGAGIRAGDVHELLWLLHALQTRAEHSRDPRNTRDGLQWVVTQLEFLQQKTYLSRDAVKRCLRWLEDRNMIVRRKMKNFYRPNAPTCFGIRLAPAASELLGMPNTSSDDQP